MRWLATLSITLLLVACTSEDVQGFRSSDKQYMEELVFLLQKAGVPYQEYQDGSIRYKSTDEDAVRKIRERITNAVSVRYEEEEAREYLKSLLSEGNREFREELKDGQVWIRWYPETEGQEKEIEMKVVQYVFDRKGKVE